MQRRIVSYSVLLEWKLSIISVITKAFFVWATETVKDARKAYRKRGLGDLTESNEFNETPCNSLTNHKSGAGIHFLKLGFQTLII